MLPMPGAEGDGAPVDPGVDLLDHGGLGRAAVGLDGDEPVDGGGVVAAEVALLDRGAGDRRRGREGAGGQERWR